MWERLLVCVACSGALASDQASFGQAPSHSQKPRVCSDERTSLLQTASVVQKRGLAATPPRPPQSPATARAAQGPAHGAGAVAELEASVAQRRGPAAAPPQPPQGSATALAARGATQSARSVREQEAAEHESPDTSNLAAVQPVDSPLGEILQEYVATLGVTTDGNLELDSQEQGQEASELQAAKPEDIAMTPAALPPLWCIQVGQVVFLSGAGAWLLCVVLLLCGQLQKWQPVPIFATTQKCADMKNGWSLYLILLSVGGQGMMVTDQYLPSLTKMQADFGTTPEAMALTLQVNWISIAVSSLFIAFVADIVGRRRTLMMTSLMTVAACMGCASAPSVDWFMAGCVVQGMSVGSATVLMMVIRDINDDRDERMGYTAAIFGALILCPSLAPALGGVIAHASSWRIPFLILAGWGLMNLISVIALLPETRTAPTAKQALEEYGSEFARVGNDRKVLLLGICQGLCLCVMLSVDATFSQVLGNDFHQNQTQIAWKLAVNTVSLLLPCITVEALSESVGVCTLLRAAMGLTLGPVIACLIVGSSLSRHDWAPLMACVLVTQLTIIAAYTGVNALYFETCRDTSGAAAGINKSLEMLIGSVGSLVASALVKGSSNQVKTLLLCIAALALLASAIFWVGFGLSPPEWAVQKDTEERLKGPRESSTRHFAPSPRSPRERGREKQDSPKLSKDSPRSKTSNSKTSSKASNMSR